eukprot:Ihof_evm2s256 gene=Ihof_evmTU2s256
MFAPKFQPRQPFKQRLNREVTEAVSFLQDFMKKKLTAEMVAAFGECVKKGLIDKYQAHWHEANPEKGSGFRCIRIHYINMDPVITEGARASGILNISQYFPSELCLWVDPNIVEYRIGDFGSINTLYRHTEPDS